MRRIPLFLLDLFYLQCQCQRRRSLNKVCSCFVKLKFVVFSPMHAYRDVELVCALSPVDRKRVGGVCGCVGAADREGLKVQAEAADPLLVG